MRTEKVKRKGRNYVLISDMKNGKLAISVNGEELNDVRYNEKRNIWYAPYVCDAGKFWAIVYNDKPWLSAAPGELTDEEFERHYIPKAYNLPMTILMLTSAILIPELIYMMLMIAHDAEYSYNIWMILVTVGYYFIVNPSPITTVKMRRLLCLWIFMYAIIRFSILGLGLLFS